MTDLNSREKKNYQERIVFFEIKKKKFQCERKRTLNFLKTMNLGVGINLL